MWNRIIAIVPDNTGSTGVIGGPLVKALGYLSEGPEFCLFSILSSL